jgi:predicted DNA-binding transcriptional regulator AlpA
MDKKMVGGKMELNGVDVLDTINTCAVINICTTKLYELIKKNLLPEPIRVGRKNFWKRSDVERYMQEQSGKNS